MGGLIMNKLNSNKLTIVMAVTVALIAPAIHAAQGTAKAWLAQAQQAAKKWQADAALTRVGTTIVKQDGTSNLWQYDFLSPKTVKCARIMIIGGGEPRTQDYGTCTPSKTIPTTFVDSPVAVAEASKAGFKLDDLSQAYLVHMIDNAIPERDCWVLHSAADFDKTKSVMRGWCVDPKTGKFVARLAGERGGKKK